MRLARISFIAIAVGLTGCAGSVDINSPSPLGDGVQGKVWHSPFFVDQELFPAGSQSDARLLLAFDADSSGSSAQIAATWLDPTDSQYKGYVRQYAESSGLAPIGPKFAQIATASPHLGFASIGAGPGGLFVANFFDSTSAGTKAVSTAFTGTSWTTYAQPNLSVTPATPIIDPSDPSQDFISGPRVVSVLDAVGRGFVFATSGDTSGRVYAMTWQSSTGLADTVQDVSGAAYAPLSGLTARFDGSKQVCVTYELSTQDLRAKCVDVSAAGSFDFATATSTSTTTVSTLSTNTMAGHDTATDGAGKIMAVFYQQGSDGKFHVYSSLANNGVWSASPSQIDSAMPSGYFAPSDTQIPGARPGVAHVGDGKFLAVWVGISASSTPKATRLYSSLYDPTSGWSAAQEISGTYDPYKTTPHPQGLHVFGNGDGNAGFALNKIHTTEAISPYPAADPDIYPESDSVRLTQVARWQSENGWLTVNTVGNACYPSTPDSSCTHRPTGVLLSSGNTLVLFIDRDNEGNRRLKGIEFKP